MPHVPKPRGAHLLNLTPMIDVTFQLLIFFVCANTWSHVESAERLPLPSPIETAGEPGQEERSRLTINLRRDGIALVSGQAVSHERLSELLQRELRKHGERLEVVLRAHREVPYGDTQAVLRACSTAGVRQVHFAVLKAKE
jgi:biopolymer transport protein ExbD